MARKPKKEKLDAKICNRCGENTTNYIVKDNAPICNECQKETEK